MILDMSYASPSGAVEHDDPAYLPVYDVPVDVVALGVAHLDGEGNGQRVLKSARRVAAYTVSVPGLDQKLKLVHKQIPTGAPANGGATSATCRPCSESPHRVRRASGGPTYSARVETAGHSGDQRKNRATSLDGDDTATRGRRLLSAVG
jgi:hypothetical protein